MAKHRFWRLNGGSAGDAAIRLPTLEMRSVVGGPNLSITGNGTATASSTTGGWPPSNAFDGSAGSVWITGGAAPHWIQWDFGVGNEQEITQFTITNEPSGAGTYCIVSGSVEFSDDGATWTPAAYISGHSTASGFSATYTYTPPGFGGSALVAPAASLVFHGGANTALSCPPPGFSAFGGANANPAAPPSMLTASCGASSSLVGPPQALYATGHDSTGENAAYLAAPRPTLSAYCGASATLTNPKPAISITATVTNFGAAALRAPAGSVSAGGTVSSTATADLNAPMATLAGYFGSVCSLTLTGGPTVFASGTTGGVGGADIRSPSPRLVSSGMVQGYGSANLLAPAGHLGATARAWLTAPSPMLTATGHAVVAATYEAYAINLSHVPGNQEPVDEVTHYTNFPFNGIVRYQSSYYGWGDDGLYLLEGTTDDANEIQYVVRTCIDDFKLTNEKNVVSAYFAGRIGPDMTVTLYAGEDGQASYNYHTANGSQARTHREKFARGVTDRYFAIGVSGKGALELADIELEINKLKRKT